MAEKYDYDLFVIGAGSGGVRASRVAASLGARVAVAEERYLGGTCVNVGCIPKKLLVYASEFSEAFKDSAGFGWAVGDRRFDWNQLIANKNVEITRLNGIYENLLIDAGVKILRSRAQIVGAHTIAIGGERITTKYILVAPANSRRRTRDHLERGLLSRSDAAAGSHCWRWLYRPRVCRNLPWLGRASHGGPSRRDFPARIRR